jgi:alkaline phosphatase D
MWGEILKNHPDIFIWGGDIVYSDTHDMELMKKNYNLQKQDSSYQYFIKKIRVMGTWDDHDYGLNDGGSEYSKKDSVQQIFLDFFDVDSMDSRRLQQGVYYSDIIKIGKNSINIIVLDTRYFRSNLTKDLAGTKRYIPNKKGEMLGDEQWKWLKNELENSNANFNIIVSSIQFLSYQHGFESWGTMPNEVLKLKKMISESKANGVIILSGDRHLAEISKDSIPGMTYPLIDFTSSGLTHSYTSYSNEENKYRISKIVSDKNFGLLHFNFEKNEVQMEIRGENNSLLESYTQKF